jgi:hypothetical protein
MTTLTSIQLESTYKENHLHFVMHVFLALSFGPLTIFIIVSTAIKNAEDDLISGTILVLVLLFFCYFSYCRFKYLYYTYFKDHSIKINYETKSILYLPLNKTILIDKVTEFVYINKFNYYIFRYGIGLPISSFAVKRNIEFENALLQFPLECNVE